MIFLMPSGEALPFHREGGHDVFRTIELIDHHSQPFDAKSLTQKTAVIYFGYTFCPDVCPNELALLSNALDKLGSSSQKFQPIFISVDPKRDTPAILKQYQIFFHPQLWGLVPADQVSLKTLTDYFGVYYQIDDQSINQNHYLINHSSFFLIIKPDGSYRPFFGIKQVSELVTLLKQYL